ncbi:ASCH domain-containing protein [Cupriavidus taiwanensis]|uniref:ASCH domain-containing protein n=1 Tax=Cupriavidus taiwanensis TaxID=164546 RepID=UPI001573C297|nr:ASCH domain-containing protein [Cupriavidus taiwanensis]NSX16166.1 ASCH domain-containing protein [Cupriavidus taiwanensis]
MKVLLSIKPEYAAKILSGEKRFEFRKAAFGNGLVKSVVIYATKPVGKVVGEFEIAEVFRDKPSKIWAKTRKFAGIDKVFFDSYYEGRDVAVAIGVGAVQRYREPLELSHFGSDITPPQSFRYLESACHQGELELL